MKLGIFAKTFEGETPDAVLGAARAAGYEAVQYNMACSGLGPLPTHVPDDAAEAIARAADAAGIEIAAVSATYNITHPDEAKRAEGRQAFEAIAAAAPRMGTRLVTVCSGSRDPDDQWRFHPDNDTPAAWDEMVAEFRRIVPVAERHGVRIGVEPELANVVNGAARARALLDLFPGGPIRIVLDPANLFEHGQTEDVRVAITEAIRLLGPDIALAHAKDRRTDGSFATAGQGAVDWPHYVGALRDAGFDGALVTHGLAAGEAEGVARFLRGIVGDRTSAAN
ncbi:sugar phosphate isomerase/epimerase family protein [Aureimonas leprariae]|uniref:Sugar phosphate isomerase/epimerase n=1 Tax=Plantimonas leprariae TaxID=2615207 RepID=A0A7V7TX45_9HYPH|nr:sugar phosphate isomerase/epimerase [Aureimonas leprariae]KAB0680290.1 sugar phosphate isomerase/epimerase [Aureimonas leprariae]